MADVVAFLTGSDGWWLTGQNILQTEVFSNGSGRCEAFHRFLSLPLRLAAM